jgi:hypothetical protein
LQGFAEEPKLEVNSRLMILRLSPSLYRPHDYIAENENLKSWPGYKIIFRWV